MNYITKKTVLITIYSSAKLERLVMKMLTIEVCASLSHEYLNLEIM